MLKIVIGVWIYLIGLVGAVVTGGVLARVLAAYPPNQVEAYGPIVPGVARQFASMLPAAPAVLWIAAAVSAIVGVYLWRSRRPLETRLFAAAVIAALNCFLAMHFTTVMLMAYFYIPKIANGG